MDADFKEIVNLFGYPKNQGIEDFHKEQKESLLSLFVNKTRFTDYSHHIQCIKTKMY